MATRMRPVTCERPASCTRPESEQREMRKPVKRFVPYQGGDLPVELVVEDLAIRAPQIGDVDSQGATPERLLRGNRLSFLAQR